MKIFVALFVLSLSLVGCGSSEPAAADTTKPAGENMVASMAKCDFCSKEMAKDQLEAHDGKMACKACIASHNH